MQVCLFFGKMPENNSLCTGCSDQYELCNGVCSRDGAALSVECAIEYFCPGCPAECSNKELINE